jgi:hypothetical protein
VASPQRLVAVPVDLALVFTPGRGWHYEPAPPEWWFEEQERLLAADDRPHGGLSLVPPLPVPAIGLPARQRRAPRAAAGG